MKRYFKFNFLFKSKVIVMSGLMNSSLLLTACSTTSGFSWSSLSPLNWFDNALIVSDQGIGEINKQTDMSLSAIRQGLDNKYRFRSGMEIKNGELINIVQGMDDDQIKIEISGLNNGKVNQIDILDEGIKTEWGTQIGMPFSELYDKAYNVCHRSDDFAIHPAVICIAPQSQNVSYIFTGTWNGPEDLMPSDDILKTWKISRIIWNAK
ncbi:MAG: RpoE-regulated lipoprotein [Enterobacteriaceae bacterium]|jgi:hypothetical protein|nr:RpoE-regulated lipoprotein [Enterobacteriaceae bacterium]